MRRHNGGNDGGNMKMMSNRRRVLQLIGLSPAAAPLAAKAAFDGEAMKLAGMVELSGGGGCPAPSANSDPSRAQIRLALMNKSVRQEIEANVYEQERFVGRLDPDLAALRSFSLNARIAFQRQRNVERRLQDMQQDWSWLRFNDIIFKAIGLKL